MIFSASLRDLGRFVDVVEPQLDGVDDVAQAEDTSCARLSDVKAQSRIDVVKAGFEDSDHAETEGLRNCRSERRQFRPAD